MVYTAKRKIIHVNIGNLQVMFNRLFYLTKTGPWSFCIIIRILNRPLVLDVLKDHHRSLTDNKLLAGFAFVFIRR